MSIARPVAGHVAGWLAVAALGLFAALSLSSSLALPRHLLSYSVQTFSIRPTVNTSNGPGLSPRSVAPSTSLHPSRPASADPSQPPAGTTDSRGGVSPGFADAGPGMVGTSEPPNTGCGLTPCTHPK